MCAWTERRLIRPVGSWSCLVCILLWFRMHARSFFDHDTLLLASHPLGPLCPGFFVSQPASVAHWASFVFCTSRIVESPTGRRKGRGFHTMLLLFLHYSILPLPTCSAPVFACLPLDIAEHDDNDLPWSFVKARLSPNLEVRSTWTSAHPPGEWLTLLLGALYGQSCCNWSIFPM